MPDTRVAESSQHEEGDVSSGQQGDESETGQAESSRPATEDSSPSSDESIQATLPQQPANSWPPSDQSPMGWRDPLPPVQQPGPGQPGSLQQPGWQEHAGPQGPGWQPPAGTWQPPANAWQQQPGSTWGQQQWPPGAQPGWGTDHWPPLGPYGSHPLAIVAAIALMVVGAFLLLIAILAIAFVGAGSAFLEQYDPTLSGMGSAVTAVFIVVFGVLLVISLLHFASAIGVFLHKSWARWMGIVLAVLGLLFGLLMLIGSTDSPEATAGALAVVVVWLGAYGLSLIGLAAGGRHFTRQATWR